MAAAVSSLRKERHLSRGRVISLVVVVALAAVMLVLATQRAAPPQIPFVKVARGSIVSTLSTNGKVEPIDWASARAERPGVVKRIFIQRGQSVVKGAPLVELDAREAGAQLESAQAQIAQAQAQNQALQQGGSSVERAQIVSDLERARLDLAAAQHDAAAVERLVNAQAAPRTELTNARQKVDQLQLQIRALEERRAALVAPTDKDIAKARLDQAQASANLARSNLGLSTIHAPLAGVVYQFDLRLGSFVNAGDLVANIGNLDRVRVLVYVDEPELGRVHSGTPVKITWDALPDHQWKGVVDRLPTQIVALGSRQVGEVGCVIENPSHDLLPGTNINAEIQSSAVQNALTIPRASLRREGAVNGVLLLAGDHVEWRPVKLGLSSYNTAQIVSGVTDGDSIALPTDKPLKNGSKVDPVYP